jgi:DNA-binding MarR family transcriptional regulator
LAASNYAGTIKNLEVKVSQGYDLVLTKTINKGNMTSTSTFPTVLRELLRTHQAFLAYAASHVHTLDLTLPQFDIIITLGDTPGMSFKNLGEKTLITKGTLTGVISRLEDKGLVQRVASETDGRSQIVRLSAAGEALYQRTYPEHLVFINRIFTDYAPEEVENLEAALLRLQQTVSALRSEGDGKPADEADE